MTASDKLASPLSSRRAGSPNFGSMIASRGGRLWLMLTLILYRIPFLFVQARLQKTPNHNYNDIGRRDALSASGLMSASWIWTSGASTGNVAFLKTFPSPGGKNATSATISMAAVNQFTLWVNGHPIGASGDGADDWKSAQVLSTALNATSNTFSVLAKNNANAGAPAPGLLAAIQVSYSDGPADTIYSDASWAISAVIPSDFPTPSDTSRFTAATLLAPFGSGSWGSAVTVSPPDPDAPTFANSTWIWSTSDAATNAASGDVGFRTTFPTPKGRIAQSATILLDVDDTFTLYLNDEYVGSPGSGWTHAQLFTMNLRAASNTFAIIAHNNPGSNGPTDPSPAGVIATIRVRYLDGGSDLVRTNTSWLSGTFTSVSDFLSAPDSALGPTYAIGTMGAQPWGQISDVFNALAAAQVPSGPFVSGTTPTNGSNTSPSNTNLPTGPDGHAPPIALIVGPIIGGIVLIVVGIAIFWSLRRRNRQRMGSQFFGAVNTHTHAGEPYQRLAMAEENSRAVTSQGVYAEPYQFSPPMEVDSYVYSRPSPGIIPPTKLTNESSIWARNAAATSSTANNSSLVAPSSVALASEGRPEGPSGQVAAQTPDRTPDPPPGYS
ncbi:hypothetical protein FB451DRAFT_65852 [Mycena latifolia]|nr:hypothetical protein FB451DRAFT_65852 [Mycena latifolia]